MRLRYDRSVIKPSSFLFSYTLPSCGGGQSRLRIFFHKVLAFSFGRVYTVFSKAVDCCAKTEYQDSSGQGAIPYRRYSPRADAFFERMHDSVKLRGRQYSLDERRMCGKRINFRFRLFAVLKRMIVFQIFYFLRLYAPKHPLSGRFLSYSLRKAVLKR